MDIREAARQAIQEILFDGEGEYRAARCIPYGEFKESEEIEETILRAFALAGYGWRDIAEARKDGTVYVLLNGDRRILGQWYGYNPTNEWTCSAMNRRISPQPTMFHELPPPPTKQTAAVAEGGNKEGT